MIICSKPASRFFAAGVLMGLLGCFLFLSTPLRAQDDILSLAFSSDGRYLALLEDSGRLLCWDLVSQAVEPLVLTSKVRGDSLAWHPEQPWLTVALEEGSGWNCSAFDLSTGRTIQWTDGPERDASPTWRGPDQLLFIRSTPDDPGEIWSLDVSSSRTQPYLQESLAQWDVRSQPERNGLVGYVSDASRWPELRWSQRPRQSQTLSSVGEAYGTKPIPAPSWSEPPLWFMYIDAPSGRSSRVIGVSEAFPHPLVLFSGEDFRNVAGNAASDRIYVEDDKGLIVVEAVRSALPRPRRENLMGLPLSRPTLGRNADGLLLAVIVDGRAVAVRNESGGEYRLLIHDLHGHLALAEKLRLRGRWDDAQGLYKSMLATLKHPSSRSEVQLHRLAQMRKQLPVEQVAEAFETLAEAEPPLVDPLRLAFERALFSLFEEHRISEARMMLENMLAASGSPPREANEAMVFLATQPIETIRLYVRARSALRREAFDDAMEACEKLARSAPSDILVIEAVLSMLADPFGPESHLERKNPYTEGHLSERMLKLLESLETEAAPILLLQERMYMQLRLRRYNAARRTAMDIFQREGQEGLGVKEFLRYFIEAERSESSAQNLMGEVLLDPAFRDALLAQSPDDAEMRALFHVASAKVALLEGDSKGMDTALSEGAVHFETLKGGSPRILGLQVYLWLYAARHCERIRQWDVACEAYDKSLRLLWIFSPEKVDMNIRIRAAYDEARLARDGDETLQEAVRQMQMILRGMGDPLVNPTRHPERLSEAVRQFEALLHSAPQPVQPFLRQHLAVALMRLRLPFRPEKHIAAGLDDHPAPSLYMALLLTRAQCDMANQDYWRALHSWETLERVLLHQAGRDVMRRRRALALAALGKRDEALELWRHLQENGTTLTLRNEARRQLETLSASSSGEEPSP